MTYDRNSEEPIREIMTAEPECVTPDTTCDEVARLMRDLDIGELIVMQDEQLQGIVTDRDLVVRCLADGMDYQSSPVSDIMTRDVITIDAEEPAYRAADLMRSERIRRLPVCEDDRVVGVVSIGDLAIELDEESALATISASPANN